MCREERAAQFRDPLRFIVLNGKGNWAIENYKKDQKTVTIFQTDHLNPIKQGESVKKELDNFLTIS